MCTGGESTTMALVAERWGLIPELQAFAASSKPIWGTCAGLIFLANRASGQKCGGQALLGGLDCYVQRNFFGSQINSFETLLPFPSRMVTSGGDVPGNAHGEMFRAIFIRAPAITEVGPDVEVLAEYHLSDEERETVLKNQRTSEGTETNQITDKAIVAVRQGRLLATSFHPELTNDVRWHKMFVDMVKDWIENESPALSSNIGEENIANLKNLSMMEQGTSSNEDRARRPFNRPADLPVYQ